MLHGICVSVRFKSSRPSCRCLTNDLDKPGFLSLRSTTEIDTYTYVSGAWHPCDLLWVQIEINDFKALNGELICLYCLQARFVRLILTPSSKEPCLLLLLAHLHREPTYFQKGVSRHLTTQESSTKVNLSLLQV